jgi:hypothetical protein
MVDGYLFVETAIELECERIVAHCRRENKIFH